MPFHLFAAVLGTTMLLASSSAFGLAAGVPGAPLAGSFFVFQPYHSSRGSEVNIGEQPSLFWSRSPNGGSETNGQPAIRLASVEYSPSMARSGWDILTIETYNRSQVYLNNSAVDGTAVALTDRQQAVAAGFGEGLTAQKSARDYFSNLFGDLNFTAPLAVESFFDANDAWMKSTVEQRGATDPYWRNVGLLQDQLEGVVRGLNHALGSGEPIFTYAMLRLLQTQGDQMDLYNALNITSPSSEGAVEREEEVPERGHSHGRSAHAERLTMLRRARRRNLPAIVDTHCSCLVALSQDFSDVYFGHATWGMYAMMLRVFKTYRLAFSAPLGYTTRMQPEEREAGSTIEVSFSSYPAVLVSIDDYYTTGAGLVVAETSFSTYNTSLYKAVTNETLLYWVRVVLANRLSAAGEQWTAVFGLHNSGTYNAMWMVLDLKRFTPSQDVPPGLLWIGEQFPGLYSTADVTAELVSGGFWGSFNVPFNRTLFALSGNAAEAATSGPQMGSWQRNVRANIWRRDAPVVAEEGLPRFMFEMQYNDYRQDPLSQGNPTYTIASRGDLIDGSGAACWGAIDAKITSFGLYAGKQVARGNTREVVAAPSLVYNGPTPQVGYFEFSTAPVGAFCPTQAPLGMVDRYNFTWISVAA